MEDVSRNLDDVTFVHLNHKMDELDAFALGDDLLASLQKQYKDAKALRIKSQKEYGANNPMTDMAIYNEDSAWCAMQTRYMELRDNHVAMVKAQNVIAEEIRVQKVAAEKKDQQKALDYFHTLQKIQTMKEDSKMDYALLIWALLIMASVRAEFFRIQNSYKFNALAA